MRSWFRERTRSLRRDSALVARRTVAFLSGREGGVGLVSSLLVVLCVTLTLGGLGDWVANVFALVVGATSAPLAAAVLGLVLTPVVGYAIKRQQRQSTGAERVEAVVKLMPYLTGTVRFSEVDGALVVSAVRRGPAAGEGAELSWTTSGPPPEAFIEATNCYPIRLAFEGYRDPARLDVSRLRVVHLMLPSAMRPERARDRNGGAGGPVDDPRRWKVMVAAAHRLGERLHPDVTLVEEHVLPPPEEFEATQQAVVGLVDRLRRERDYTGRLLVDVTSGTHEQRLAAVFAAITTNDLVGMALASETGERPARWTTMPFDL